MKYVHKHYGHIWQVRCACCALCWACCESLDHLGHSCIYASCKATGIAQSSRIARNKTTDACNSAASMTSHPEAFNILLHCRTGPLLERQHGDRWRGGGQPRVRGRIGRLPRSLPLPPLLLHAVCQTGHVPPPCPKWMCLLMHTYEPAELVGLLPATHCAPNPLVLLQPLVYCIARCNPITAGMRSCARAFWRSRSKRPHLQQRQQHWTTEEEG